MGRSASPAIAAKWRERIEEWRGSELLIADFCRQKDLSQSLFFAWRKRLAADETVPAQPQPQQVGSSRGPARFVEVTPPVWPVSGGVQLTLPGGAVVQLPPDASCELVATAIRAAIMPPAEARRC